MKTPEEGASYLLQNSIAPPGSGRTAILIGAAEDDGLYRFEYAVDRGERQKPLRAISVVAQTVGEGGGGELVTLTVTAPEEDWSINNDLGTTVDKATKLRKIASSFHVR